jgi:beta-barrel assembly-enhancing protease
MSDYRISATLPNRFNARPLDKSNHHHKSVKEKASSGYNKILDAFAPRNPVNKHREIRIVPLSIEIAIGTLLYSGMVNSLGGHYNDNDYETLVNQAGNKLAKASDRPELPFQFSVIKSNVLNAWCAPGGKVAFYKGLIDRMDKEKDSFGVGHFTLEEKIAAVLGHEITHAAARHSARGIELSILLFTVSKTIEVALHIFLAGKMNDKDIGSPGRRNDPLLIGMDWVFARVNALIFKLIQLHSTRGNEYEADKYGMVYLKRAGYDPKAAIWVQKFFAKEQPKTHYTLIDKAIHVLSSHPHSEDRAKRNEKTLEEINKKILT